MSFDWNNYLVKGIPVDPKGNVPLRENFHDLSKEKRYLYLEGLKKFHHTGKDDPLSYFQIAGIHGKPYQTWPFGNKDILQEQLSGFCTHSSVLFLTWHRPYLSLFETTLRTHVKEVADGIAARGHPDKDQYLKLAEDFRIPYWDWARTDSLVVPEEALDPTYNVDGPPWQKKNETPLKKYNPLYEYPFPPGIPADITLNSTPNQKSTNTVRYPGTGDSEKVKETILAEMTNFYNSPDQGGLPQLTPGRNLTERVVYILQKYNTFNAASSNKLRTGPNKETLADMPNWGSLEDIHNAVHNLMGGGGHMSRVPVSAFDPIFWLHHTNIDRLFDIWQALHEDDNDPKTFIVPRQSAGTFGIKGGTDETMDTQLFPFRPNVDSWYTSKKVRATKSFGYNYNETAGLNYPTTTNQKTALMKEIGRIYGSLAKFIRQSKQGNPTAGATLLPQAHIINRIVQNDLPATNAQLKTIITELPSNKALLNDSLQESKPFLKDLAPNNKYLEWLTNIKAEKHTLDGAYSVHVFLGPPQEPNAALWAASPTYVGSFDPLGQSSDTGCSKCIVDQRDRTEITAQIPLTIALVERYLAGIIHDLTPENVVPYLTKELHWRVINKDGIVLENRATVDGLTVAVVSNEVTIPEDDNLLPIYSPNVIFYPEITTNEDGGGRGEGTGLTNDQLPTTI